MKITLIRILVCLLLIFPVFSVTTLANPDTELELYILGSLPIRLYSHAIFGEIHNTGNTTAYNVSYEITLTGGFGETINETITGYEPEILPDYLLAIAVMYIHGFGPVHITFTVSASNAETVSGTATGYQIGSYTWIPLSWFSLFFKG